MKFNLPKHLEKIGGIYIIECGNDSYIGATSNFKQRYLAHVNCLKYPIWWKPNYAMYELFRENPESVVFSVLEVCLDRDARKELEREYFALLKPSLNVYPVKIFGKDNYIKCRAINAANDPRPKEWFPENKYKNPPTLHHAK